MAGVDRHGDGSRRIAITDFFNRFYAVIGQFFSARLKPVEHGIIRQARGDQDDAIGFDFSFPAGVDTGQRRLTLIRASKFLVQMTSMPLASSRSWIMNCSKVATLQSATCVAVVT